MLFGKKSKKSEEKCSNCRSEVMDEYSFCPYCGNVLFEPERRAKEFGMLGKHDSVDGEFLKQRNSKNNLSITDKMISSLMNSLVKNLDEQFKEMGKSGSETIPKNIKINIGIQNPKMNKEPKRNLKHDFSINNISSEQLSRMSSLPKKNAKTAVKRLGDKVIYELEAPGIESIKDIFVSKLESGYEIKALAKNKVYVNSLPVNLPINSFALDKEKLSIEFSPNLEQ